MRVHERREGALGPRAVAQLERQLTDGVVVRDGQGMRMLALTLQRRGAIRAHPKAVSAGLSQRVGGQEKPVQSCIDVSQRVLLHNVFMQARLDAVGSELLRHLVSHKAVDVPLLALLGKRRGETIAHAAHDIQRRELCRERGRQFP